MGILFSHPWMTKPVMLELPQITLAIGVLTVLVKGPCKVRGIRHGCRGAFSIVIYSTWWHLPSKTHSKIDILRELLHSVREWHHFYELTWLRSPWEPLGSPFWPISPVKVGDRPLTKEGWYNNEKCSKLSKKTLYVSHRSKNPTFPDFLTPRRSPSHIHNNCYISDFFVKG